MTRFRSSTEPQQSYLGTLGHLILRRVSRDQIREVILVDGGRLMQLGAAENASAMRGGACLSEQPIDRTPSHSQLAGNDSIYPGTLQRHALQSEVLVRRRDP